MRSIKGVGDIYGIQAKVFQEILRLAVIVAGRFGFTYLELPKMEYRELFTQGVGEQTDIVSKELFHWQDQGGREICLRPEGTAQTVRFLIEQGQLREQIQRYFYEGSMFRAENPQRGRLREFHQIGLEIFGEPSFLADVELIHYAWVLLRELGIHTPVLMLNSLGCEQCRPRYLEKLNAYLISVQDSLSPLSKIRLVKNPLRILDSKDPQDRELLLESPSILEELCSECQQHFDGVCKSLESLDIPFQVNYRLVRGLDYYTKTVFEITIPDLLGSQDAICGGGRYDGLVKKLSHKEDLPAVGLALGVERLLLAMESLGQVEEKASLVKICVILDESVLTHYLKSIAQGREAGQSILIDVTARSISKKLSRANKLGADFVAMIGEREIETQSFSVKNLKTGVQKILSIQKLDEFLCCPESFFS